MNRKKVNDRFEFGLELNVAAFLQNPPVQDCDELNYELQAVLIHRGSAFGGHYHAYIRDVIGQGKWDELMNRFKEEKQK